MFGSFLTVQMFLCLIFYFALSAVAAAMLDLSKDVTLLMFIGSFVLCLPTAYISLEGGGAGLSICGTEMSDE